MEGRANVSKPVEKECRSVDHFTPTKVVDAVHFYFTLRGKSGILLDPATSEDNPTRAHNWYTREHDGLKHPWVSGTFVNPPYGEELRAFVDKIIEEARAGKEIVALLPTSRSEQDYWQRLWWDVTPTGDVQVRKRLAFMTRGEDGKYTPQKSNPYQSQILCYNGTFNHCVKAFRSIGTCKAYRMIVRGPE